MPRFFKNSVKLSIHEVSRKVGDLGDQIEEEFHSRAGVPTEISKVDKVLLKSQIATMRHYMDALEQRVLGVHSKRHTTEPKTPLPYAGTTYADTSTCRVALKPIGAPVKEWTAMPAVPEVREVKAVVEEVTEDDDTTVEVKFYGFRHEQDGKVVYSQFAGSTLMWHFKDSTGAFAWIPAHKATRLAAPDTYSVRKFTWEEALSKQSTVLA